MITVEYRCADGTPFPVRFATEEDAAATWVVHREHSTHPATPLGDALNRMSYPGTERAYVESGLPSPSMWKPGPHAFGFGYSRDAGIPDDEMQALFAGSAVLVQKYGSARGIWHDHSLPRTKEACARLDEAGDDRPLVELAVDHSYAHAHTMVPVGVSGNDLRLLTEVIKPVVGDDADIIANELTQGYENDTLAADQELWLIGRAASESEPIAEPLATADPRAALATLRARGAEPAFFEALDRFLAHYGRRAEEWDEATLTWSEQGAGFWAQLRVLAASTGASPKEARDAAAARREALFAEIDAKLAADPDAQARFRRRYERAESYVAVREERALWQLIATGCLRHALLRRGACMVERGQIASPDDILYLLPDEIEGDERDLHTIAKERRAEHDRWKTIEPPPRLGGDPAQTPQAAISAASNVLQGIGGSRGVATGRARVVTDLADADRVDQGDVLVCVMTSPPWTPLFAVASAVVVDNGGPGSHAAIAAREYGIPAVLGVKVGTSAIPDGATVTVDGDKGTVTIA